VADAADPDANIIFGATIDDDLDDQVWVTVIAAGLSGTPARAGASAARTPATRVERGRRQRSEPTSLGTGGSDIAEPPEAPDLSADVPPPVEPKAPPEAPPVLAAAPDPEPDLPVPASSSASQDTQATPPPSEQSTRLFNVEDGRGSSDPDGGSAA